MGHNILIGLSGGPSVAINSSMAGIMSAAARAGSKIYGARHGIVGVLQDDLVDLSPYCSERELAIISQTPAMALGSCRHKLSEESMEQIVHMLKKYDIGCFFYIGGNDSMDTVKKLHDYFEKNKLPIQVIGVPKTIDNDLPVTDHTPGFGSSAKYLYHTMSEIYRDSKIYPVKNVVIVEIMGRDSGWLTLAASLSRFLGGAMPQIIAIPEVSFDEMAFIEQVKAGLEVENTIICAVSEGITTADGNYVGMSAKSGNVDIFGHTYLSGVGKYLEGLVAREIGCKVRSIELNVMQRCSAHLASKTDLDEGFMVGERAFRYSQEGKSGITLVIKRVSDKPYKIEISDTPVENIANKTKLVPQSWHDLDKKQVQEEIAAYLLPLIKGDCTPIVGETGLPLYIEL